MIHALMLILTCLSTVSTGVLIAVAFPSIEVLPIILGVCCVGTGQAFRELDGFMTWATTRH